MGKIIIEGMEFYAYHGHFEEEQIVGGKFLVDIIIDTDTDKAAKSDSLEDALDYQSIYNDIKGEMEITSYLLENITYRIMDRLFNNHSYIEHVILKVTKLNPPIGGKVNKVSIQLEKRK